jgi:Thioredoxin like C-terminal domain
VIGVHSPEFGFEQQLPNIRWGAKNYRVDYPIAVDNDFAVWRGFSNQYWPALYLIDGKSKVRHRKFGEGGYEESERAIQELLAEAGARGVGKDLASVQPAGVEEQADWDDVKSPETYVGTDRGENRVSSGARLKLNQWALEGDWTEQRQAAVLDEANGRITYRFHARDLNLVMGPGTGGKPVRFRVLIDGQPPGAAHGVDVDEQGNGAVAEPRMYQLIRQSGSIADRQFEIQFLDPGVEVFVFTFG